MRLVWAVIPVCLVVSFLSTTPMGYGQVDNFCWPIPLQKEIKQSEKIFVGNLISTTTTDLHNRTVIFDVTQTIKGDIPDSVKINLLSRQIVDLNEKIENEIQIPMKNLFESHHLIPYEPEQWLIFQDSIEFQIGCNTNSGGLNYYAIDDGEITHRTNMLNYFFSDDPPPPLKQINESWNRHGDYICENGMVHVRSHSYTMACVTPSTAEKLVERGAWISLGY